MGGNSLMATAATSTGGFVSRTATEQSTIIVEKRDASDRVVEISPVKSIVYNKQPSNGPTTASVNGFSLQSNNDVEMKTPTSSATTTTTTTTTSTTTTQAKSTSNEPTPKTVSTSIG